MITAIVILIFLFLGYMGIAKGSTFWIIASVVGILLAVVCAYDSWQNAKAYVHRRDFWADGDTSWLEKKKRREVKGGGVRWAKGGNQEKIDEIIAQLRKQSAEERMAREAREEEEAEGEGEPDQKKETAKKEEPVIKPRKKTAAELAREPKGYSEMTELFGTNNRRNV